MLLLLSQMSAREPARPSPAAPDAHRLEERRDDPAGEFASAVRVSRIEQRAEADIIVKIASNRAELEAAFRLVYQAYLRSGLALRNPYEMRITPYQLLPTTEVFVAKAQDQVIATLSLVRDGDLGLPMEAIYPEEVADFRVRGIRVGEVSCLASRERTLRHSLPIVMRLMSLMAQCAEHRGVNRLLIAVHPRHVRFYESLTAFETIGGEKSYETVLGKPAVAMALDLDLAPIDHVQLYRKFFGVPFPQEVFRPQPMAEAVRAELESVVEASYDAASCFGPMELVA